MLSGDAPSEAVLTEKAEGARIMHLATHGFFASGECRSTHGSTNPMALSGLVLAGANTENAAAAGGW